MQGGVGEGRRLAGQQPADMVAVHVGEQHGVDVLGRYAECCERGGQPPEPGSEGAARAAVDQHRAAAAAHEVGGDADGRRHRRVQEGGGQRRVDLLLRDVDEERPREREAAVADGEDLQLADPAGIGERHRHRVLGAGGAHGDQPGREQSGGAAGEHGAAGQSERHGRNPP